MLTRRPKSGHDQGLVSIYRRPEAYYAVSSMVTTAGVWVYGEEPPTVIAVDATPAELGSSVMGLLSRRADEIPHPRQDEWTQRRRSSLAPIKKSAGVRSWRAFLASAELVQVGRRGQKVSVDRMVRDAKRKDVFVGASPPGEGLTSPTGAELGGAIAAAFA